MTVVPSPGALRDLDRTPVLLGDAAHQRQSQARSLLSCREEGREGLLPRFRAHAFAVVNDGDHQTALVPRGPHHHVPTRRRRLKGIQHQVEDGLLELEAVEQRPLGSTKIEIQRHPLLRAFRRDEGREVRDEGPHWQPLEIQPRRAGEPQELRDEVVKTLDLSGDLPEHLEHVRVAAWEELQKLLFEDAEVDLHRVERVADLVRDSGGERLDEARLLRGLAVHSGLALWLTLQTPSGRSASFTPGPGWAPGLVSVAGVSCRSCSTWFGLVVWGGVGPGLRTRKAANRSAGPPPFRPGSARGPASS